MTNASRAKRKRAAVRSAKRSRHNTWWYGLTAIVVILGISLITYARMTAPSPVGPFLTDAANPTKKDTHWHAALGVYDCDHWMGDTPGSGVWNWPFANAQNQPSRADNQSVYAGLHSHNDGVIHMEPLVSSEAGKNATVGLYFNYGGWKLSSTGFSFLGTTVKNGDKCGAKTGTLQWEVGTWDGDTTGKVKQKYTVQTGNPSKYKLHQYDIVVIAFLPQGKSLASIGSPPSVPNLAKALGVENVAPGASSATTMPPVTNPPAATPTTKPTTGSTKAPTPTTSKP
ncbi:MAG TPA: hypothetical protein VGP92_05975 [Acidimicrobiia bacterium]|nr:hypothetical protein [Acidimicrobiia bacterium]